MYLDLTSDIYTRVRWYLKKGCWKGSDLGAEDTPFTFQPAWIWWLELQHPEWIISNIMDGSHVLEMVEHRDKNRSNWVAHGFVENSIAALNYLILAFFERIWENKPLQCLYHYFYITVIHTKHNFQLLPIEALVGSQSIVLPQTGKSLTPSCLSYLWMFHAQKVQYQLLRYCCCLAKQLLRLK